MSSDEPMAEHVVDGTAEADPTEFGGTGDPGETGELGDLDETGEGWDLDGTDELEPPSPGARPRILAVVLGLLIALAGAVGWGELTTATGRRFALLAVVVGILLGLVVRRVGKLSGVAGGLIAGILSLFSAALGQFIEGYLLQAKAINDAQVVDLKHRNWSVLKQWQEWGFSHGWDVFTKNLGGLSWLTLVLAAAAAYIFASDSGKRKPKPIEDLDGDDDFDGEDLDGFDEGAAAEAALDGEALDGEGAGTPEPGAQPETTE